MPLPVTALYSALLAGMVTLLAVNVALHRARFGIGLGDGESERMRRMIRMHANAAEYVPIALLLMAVYELNGGRAVALHVIGTTLVAARLLHIYGLARSSGPSLGRNAGANLTWLSILALAVLNAMKIV
jgi:uncharacterized protein